MRNKSILIIGKFIALILISYTMGNIGLNAIAATPTFTIAFNPTTIGPGGISTLTYTINNSSNTIGVSGLTFSNTLPTGVTIANPSNAITTCINGSFSATPGSNNISFNDYRLGKGESCTFILDVTSGVPGSHVNTTGALSTSAGSAGTANATITVDSARPSFNKSFSPSTITPGSVSTLTFTVDNSLNGSKADLLVFTDTLPNGMVISNAVNASTTCTGGVLPNPVVVATPGGDAILMQFGHVAAGASCTLSVDVTTVSTGTYVNTSGQLTQNGSNPSGIAKATLLVQDSFLSASFPALSTPGSSVKLLYQMRNIDRNNTASGITFTNDLNVTLSGLTATALPANGFCGQGSTITGSSNLTVAGASLASGESCSFEVTVLIPSNAAAGSYTNNTSTINLTLGSPTTKPAVSNTLLIRKAPTLSATFIDDPVLPGGDVTLRYILTNTDSVNAASNINFTEIVNNSIPLVIKTLPAANSCGNGSTFVNSTDDGETFFIKVDGANVVAGGSCTFDVILTVPAEATPGSYAFTTSTIASTVSGATLYGSAATDNLVVVAAPLLTASITEASTVPGSTVTLQFNLTNSINASADATGIGFTDNINNMLSGATSITAQQNDICGSGSQLSGTSNLTFSGGTLAPGESCSFSVTLQIPSGATPGLVTNTTSSVSATVSGVSVTSSVASDTLTISGLTFTRSFVPNPTYLSTNVVLRYTINNAASALAATAIQFTDNLSQVISSFAATSLPNTPCNSGSTITGTTNLTFSGGNLQPGESCTFDVTATLPVNFSQIGGHNFSTSDMSATVNGNNTSTQAASATLTINESFVYSLVKSFTNDPVIPGETVKLNYIIKRIDRHPDINVKQSAFSFSDDFAPVLQGLELIDLLPGSFSDFSSSSNCTNVATLAKDGTAKIVFNSPANVEFDTTCSFNVMLQVPTSTVHGKYTSTSVGSGIASVADDLLVQPLRLTSSFLNGTLEGSSTAQLEFNLVNNDKQIATNIIFKDDLNALISNLVATDLPKTSVCGAGSTLSGTSTITLSNGTLPAGDSCTFRMKLAVPVSTVAGGYINTTSLVNSTLGGVTVPNSAAVATFLVHPSLIWGDFSFTGFKSGAEHEPFSTLDDAINEVGEGGVLLFKPGVTNEKPTITKRVIIKASGGSVVIGAN